MGSHVGRRVSLPGMGAGGMSLVSLLCFCFPTRNPRPPSISLPRGSLSALAGRASCGLFSPRKVFPDICSSYLEFRVFLHFFWHVSPTLGTGVKEPFSDKQGDFGEQCLMDILHFVNGRVSPSVPGTQRQTSSFLAVS